jgi:sulfur relay (sulfurtransferase) DsrC/TusE family protein
LQPSISTAAGIFAVVYNGITGFADKVRVDGKGRLYDSPKWKCNNAAEYARLEQINTSGDKWEINLDELKRMLIIYNPAADSASIYKQLESVTAESVLNARGL